MAAYVANPALGSAMTFATSYGSHTEQARQEGAGYGQQQAFGLGSAALDTGTNAITVPTMLKSALPMKELIGQLAKAMMPSGELPFWRVKILSFWPAKLCAMMCPWENCRGRRLAPAGLFSCLEGGGEYDAKIAGGKQEEIWDWPGMHGRAVSEGHDQPRMHGRAVSEGRDQPGMHG